MAEIQPFRAYRYDTNRVSLKDVLTQPYDKISPAMQERYYAASPYNLITIEKGRILSGDADGNNVYTRAAQKVDEWIAEKILVQDAKPSIYIYSQEFLVPGTQTRRVRMGFIALGRVEDYDAQVVFRHERTLSAPRPTVSNCSGAHAFRPGSFFCCTTIRRARSITSSRKRRAKAHLLNSPTNTE